MALLYVIDATYYEVVSKTSRNVEKKIRKSSIGEKKSHKVVTKIYGNLPVLLILPELILSTDDTVNYMYEGKGSYNGIFRLVASKENANTSTRSKYKNEDTKNMCGLRFKITYTFSAAGTMDSIFISELRINKRDLPKDSIVLIKIIGLCVGG